jgi:hypothetical protein
LDNRNEVNPDTVSRELIDVVQRRLKPSETELVAWGRDPSFGTLIDPAGRARTGAEMRDVTIAPAAVEVAAATRRDTSHT